MRSFGLLLPLARASGMPETGRDFRRSPTRDAAIQFNERQRRSLGYVSESFAHLRIFRRLRAQDRGLLSPHCLSLRERTVLACQMFRAGVKRRAVQDICFDRPEPKFSPVRHMIRYPASETPAANSM